MKVSTPQMPPALKSAAENVTKGLPRVMNQASEQGKKSAQDVTKRGKQFFSAVGQKSRGAVEATKARWESLPKERRMQAAVTGVSLVATAVAAFGALMVARLFRRRPRAKKR